MRRRALLIGFALMPTRVWAGGGTAVATFSILGSMARRIAGDRMTVVSLVGPDTDAHTFQPRASESRTVGAAALLVESGLGLEGWMARLGQASGFKGRRITASAGVTPRTMMAGAAVSTDPHAWQDPRNGAIYARNIGEGLVAADPANAALYRANTAAFVTEIEATDAWIESAWAAIPPTARRIVTTHDAFGYYGARYKVTFLAAEGVSPDSEPSAKGIAALVTQIKREKVRSVFLENMTDPRIAAMLARETGATLEGPLFSDALSKPEGPAPDYLSMLRHNTALLVRAARA